METTLDYNEQTGLFTRIGVLAETEQQAIDFAEAEVGGFSYAWTDPYLFSEVGGSVVVTGWEVVFETCQWL